MSANAKWSPRLPAEVLEMRASEERQRIHESVVELRSQVHEALDVHRLAREYVFPASGTAAVLGILAGFGDGLFCYTENFTTGVVIAFRKFDDFFVTGSCRYTTFNACHSSISFIYR